MSRWTALTVPEIVETKETLNNGSYLFVALFLIVAVAISIIVAASGSKGRSSMQQVPLENLVVLDPKVISVEPTVQPSEPTVRAKTVSLKNSVWDSEDNIPEPFLQAESGQSFTEFKRTFDTERELYSTEKSAKVNTQLSSMKKNFDKKGLGLEDFVNTFGVPISEELAASWSSEQEPKKSSRTDFAKKNSDGVAESEFRMLAQEALQNLPTDCNSETATIILRDILAAYTEAARIDLQLPEMPKEQAAAIEYWAKSKKPANEIANLLLSRI